MYFSLIVLFIHFMMPDFFESVYPDDPELDIPLSNILRYNFKADVFSPANRGPGGMRREQHALRRVALLATNSRVTDEEKQRAQAAVEATRGVRNRIFEVYTENPLDFLQLRFREWLYSMKWFQPEQKERLHLSLRARLAQGLEKLIDTHGCAPQYAMEDRGILPFFSFSDDLMCSCDFERLVKEFLRWYFQENLPTKKLQPECGFPRLTPTHLDERVNGVWALMQQAQFVRQSAKMREVRKGWLDL